MKDIKSTAHRLTRQIVQQASSNGFDIRGMWDSIVDDAEYFLGYWSDKHKHGLEIYRAALNDMKLEYGEYLA